MKNSRMLALLLAVVLLFGLVGCGAKSAISTTQEDTATKTGDSVVSQDGSTSGNTGIIKDAAQPGSTGSTTTTGAPDTARKQIWYGSMEFESVEYDKALAKFETLVKSLGGYVAASDKYNYRDTLSGILKSSNLSVRIPADKFDTFLAQSAKVATLINTSTWMEDISDTYYVAQAHLNSLKIKEQRLLELLKTQGDLQYLLQVETELANTRYEIESLEGTLRRYDSMVAYSSITITLREVTPAQAGRETPVTLWERIGDQFAQSWESLKNAGSDFVVFVVGGLPILLPVLLVIALVCYGIVRLARRNKKIVTTEVKQPPESPEKPEDK